MKDFNKYFDHTLLKADSKLADIRQLCSEAIEYDFASVCVNGCYVADAVKLLADTDINVTAVAGFPLRSHDYRCKARRGQGCSGKRC